MAKKPDTRKPRRSVKEDEARLFEAAMRGVKPLSERDRNPPAKSEAKTATGTVRQPPSSPAPPVPPVPPAPPKRSTLPELRRGIAADLDARTMERLRRGQLRPEVRLDMHGMTQDEAHRALVGFIAASRNAGRRCVILITGRGRAKLGGGILREQAPRWLNLQPTRGHILGFAEAQPKDGGAGALYVLLRKKKS
jgi:DNA-nicking Smr family endonuclease